MCKGKSACVGVISFIKENEFVIDAKEIKQEDKYLITLSKRGIIKKSQIKEFELANRATRGKKISGVRENDSVIKMLTFEKDCDIIIIVNKRNIKISTEELQETGRTASGVKGIDIKDNEEALDLLISIGE